MLRARAVWALPLGLSLGLLLFAACEAGGGASSGSGGGGPSSEFDAGSDDAGFDKDAACATASDQAVAIDVNLYILFDKSGSMIGPKWSQATAALQAFFMDPLSADLNVALRFFPDEGCDTSCNVAACAQPKVPLGTLTHLSAPTDAQEQALLDAFIDVSPSGGTPLSAALDGGFSWARDVLSTSPKDKAVVVLVTDGAPMECETAQSYFESATQQAYTTDGIITFAIGLEGSNEALMNAIAAAGGTDSGYFIGAGDVQGELQAALEAIRDNTIACEFAVPDSVDGAMVEPTKVNVLYTPGGATVPVTIGQVASEADCKPATGGWYYDDPVNPRRIRLCDVTCEAIQADTGGLLELLFGCSTIPA